MKIIHCGDIHLDSKMTSNLSKEQARERKMEILRTFTRMVDYAKKNGILLSAKDIFIENGKIRKEVRLWQTLLVI